MAFKMKGFPMHKASPVKQTKTELDLINEKIKLIQKEQSTWHELSQEELDLKQAEFTKLVDKQKKLKRK